MPKKNLSKSNTQTRKSSNKIFVLNLDTWNDYRLVLRDSILDWFVSIAEEVLDIRSRQDLVNNIGLSHLYSYIKSKLQTQLKKPHLPVGITVPSLNRSVTLEIAINILRNQAITGNVRCGLSGGIPPKLTAELAEHVRTFLGPRYEKKEIFDLCEDIIALAEVGAFISKVGFEKIERRLIHHYIYTNAFTEIIDPVKRVELYIDMKRLGRRLLGSPYHTFIAGISATIAKNIEGVSRLRGIETTRSGIIFDYVRLEPRNVLNIAGFERLLIDELVSFLLRKKIARPLNVLIRIYPTTNELKEEKPRNERTIGALKLLKGTIDILCRSIVKYLDSAIEIKYYKGKTVVVRDPRLIYDIIRALDTFTDRLNKEADLKDILNNRLPPRLLAHNIDVVELARRIMFRLAST